MILPYCRPPQDPPARAFRPKVAARAGGRREPPVILPIREAEPTEVRVCYAPTGAFTAIFRTWPPGTTGPGGLCRRCPTCRAPGDTCFMIVPGIVPRSEAGDYSPIRAGVPCLPT